MSKKYIQTDISNVSLSLEGRGLGRGCYCTCFPLKKLFFILILFLFTIPCIGLAEDIAVSASLEKRNLELNESTVFVITVTGTSKAEHPALPSLDFANIQYVGPSTQISYVNGKSSSKIAFQYYFIAVKEGNHTIPAITVNVSGKNIMTQPVPLTISSSSQAGVHSGSTDQDYGFDAKDILIEIETDADEVYIDQQILLSLRIYINQNARNIADIQFSLPQMDDFIAEKTLEKGQSYVRRNGINYLKTEYKWILFPAKEGEIVIPAVGVSYNRLVKTQKRQRTRSPFDDFFNRNYKTIPKRALSDQVKIIVLPLPDKDRPDSFSGTVGSYEMDVDIQPQKDFLVGAPVNITITIKGTGHISSISAPVFAGEENFRSFPPETSVETESLEDVQRGKKVFKKVLIPKQEGTYPLPVILFSYFDPVIKEYSTLKSEEQEISVEKGKSETVFIGTKPGEHQVPAGRHVTYKGQDILTVKDTFGKPADISWNNSRMPLTLIFLYPVFILLAEGALTIYRRRLANPQRIRNQNAYRVFRKNCHKLRFGLSQNSEAFYKDVMQVLSRYISDKTGLPAGGITSEIIESELIPSGMDEKNAAELKEIFEKIDTTRFGAGARDIAVRKEDISRLENIIKKIEKTAFKGRAAK